MVLIDKSSFKRTKKTIQKIFHASKQTQNQLKQEVS